MAQANDIHEEPDVEIISKGKKLTFECDNCGCKFKVSKKFTKYKQTGMNEYNYAFKCPECGQECYYYGHED